MKIPRIALTGGIACGKSEVARILNRHGIATIDADDVVHELLPDPAERRRLAAEVFADPVKRKALEAKLHPLVRAKIDDFLRDHAERGEIAVAVIPLLFETHWDSDYDIIACVASSRETQIERMLARRGYPRQEAEARLAAQLPVAEKAEKSQYVINNEGSVPDLEIATERFVSWLKNSMCSPVS